MRLASILPATLLLSPPPRPRQPRPAAPRVLPVWRAVVLTNIGNGVYEAAAHTKSEARAAIKEQLGLPKHGRLPPRTKVWRTKKTRAAA